MMKTIQTRRPGTSVVESTVALIPLLLIILALVEYCFYEKFRHQLLASAREGARLSAVGKESLDQGDIKDRVDRLMISTHPETLSVKVYRSDSKGKYMGNWKSAHSGDFLTVRIKGQYRPLFPAWGFLVESVPIRAMAVTRNEVN